MIELSCANCGQPMVVDDALAGRVEFCPACGELNDIPLDVGPDPQDLQPAVQDSDRRGTLTWLWWTIALVAVGIFALAIWIVIFTNNWETAHLQMLSDTATRADAAFNRGDFSVAQQDFQFILSTLDDRKLRSIYLNTLRDHARAGEEAAKQHLAAAASRPTTER